MSGIAGIVNLDGAPVDRELLRRMAAYMTFRGPDAQRTWVQDNVGFGHAMLRTTCEAEFEEQPSTLDGHVWIVADARIDGRPDLIRELAPHTRRDLKGDSDPDLILHAYRAWGEACIEHLLGDFVFAIWDGPHHRLFCARDHFGVKPFYYARVGNCIVFSNTLNCVRLHPEVSDELNDLAIADFLLFDYNQDLATTTFADIQRIPPAHTLTCTDGRLLAQRYWTLPIDECTRFNRSQDYVDRFSELFRVAVGDRLRTHSAGVFLSGGLDSTSVAATANELLGSGHPPSPRITGYTAVFDKLFSDPERKYSKIFADAVQIPIQYLVTDQYEPYDPPLSTPEPYHDPYFAKSVALVRKAAEGARVTLTGDGGDPVLFYGCRSYLLGMLRDLKIGCVLKELAGFFVRRGRIPLLGIRSSIKSWFLGRPNQPDYPVWLNIEFVVRLNLEDRWQCLNRPVELVHTVRPQAYRILNQTFWPSFFESGDAGTTRCAIETRYPFFDVRLVRYLLSIPPLPWFEGKEILREAGRRVLPEEIRTRPKTPLAAEPLQLHLRDADAEWWNRNFQPHSGLSRYIRTDRVTEGSPRSPDALWVNLRPVSLNYWLQLQTSPI